MEDERRAGATSRTTAVAVVGGIIVALIMVAGTLWMGREAAVDTERAVRSVSLLYLDELADRREQVVASNLQGSVRDLRVAIELMEPEDLADEEHLQAYQARMRRLYNVEKFAFVDTEGLIHTALGIQTNIDDYAFDQTGLEDAEISVLNLEGDEKKVIIAVPVDIAFDDTNLVIGFMEIDVSEMLSGVSMSSSAEGTTFCNLYTADGVALTDMVLGGLAREDNLIDAMRQAQFEEGYSFERFADEFSSLTRGEVSFVYDGVRETLAYVPVEGTDWLLTYLIRESVISEEISQVTDGIVRRGVIQTLLSAAALAVVFLAIMFHNRRRAAELIDQQTKLAEQRTRRLELEERLELQERLLQQERGREEQHQVITALASDYRSVYLISLDTGEGVCYQAHPDIDDGVKLGEHFDYLSAMATYAEHHITEPYREEVMRFVQGEAIRTALADSMVISCRYVVSRKGHESFEMLRIAAVRRPEDRDDGVIHTISACMADVDAETRAQLAQNQALTDALDAAERASHAKTSFLSNMSHEIRTPMNAIIGLDAIALADPEVPERTRDHLTKIGESADHLLSLINDILDMSRIESGTMALKSEEFSFPRLLEAVNTMFFGQCEDKGLTYACHVVGEVDDAYVGDATKLRQVLINILGNAVKFTPEGGSVELSVERRARFGDQTTICFTVSDTGIGMSEEFLPHIFDTFAQEDDSRTNRYGSSGLGMAITKSMVEMMNGDIEVTSVKGEGTTFVVSVTLTCAERSERGEEPQVDPSRLSVLVVDDDEVAREHARVALGRAGIACETAATGAEAVEMVRLRQARQDSYNLVLLDWRMPEMDGIACARQIRSVVGERPAIIILTAYRFDDIVDEALEAGVDAFLSKPFFAAAVLEEFEAAARRRGIEVGAHAEPADLSGRRVLLAEDVDINAEILAMVLEMREIVSERAVNGREAVDMFAVSEPGHFDAILMDMRMPEMDGLEATRRIRAMERADAKAIPIIALTANAFDEDVQRSLQAGLDAHLSKPVQPEVLFETLESLL